MMRDGYKDEIVLLTGPRAVLLADLVETINQVTSKSIVIEKLPFEQYAKVSAVKDEGCKPEGWFEKRISWYAGIEKGDGRTADPLMEELLGRVSKDGRQVVRELLDADLEYIWHQNYVKKS